MKRPSFLGCTAALVSCVSVNYALAQDAPPHDAAQSGIVLSRLSPPVYPPLARTARIEGEVRVLIVIDPEGETKSASIVSGNQLLQQAALQSAEQSKFECKGCTASAQYEVVYSFELLPGKCPDEQKFVSKVPDGSRELGASQSGNRVVVVAEQACIGVCDAMIRLQKVRSLKCLYLWKCAYPKKGGGWQ